MQKIVPKIIIGTSGQVASSLRAEFAKKINATVWSTSRLPNPNDKSQFFLDLSKAASIEVFFSNFQREFPGQKTEVYLPGAMTHVDRCEQEQELCTALNIQGPVHVAEQCEKYGHRLCFYSSEYVFGEDEYHGGAVGPFSELDKPAPTSFYGKSKLAAENELMNLLKNNPPLIIRTTMVFSYEKEGMNFVMQVLRHLNRWSGGDYSQNFRVPQDQISTPTYAPALANASIALMEKKQSGIWNIVGKDLISRKEFIEKIIRTFSYPENLMNAFQYLTTKELNQVARRPLTAGLSVQKAVNAGIKIMSLEEAFRDFQTRSAANK